jgi:hypothetical protein
MNKESNEQNRNEKDISNRVLSWFGEYKMKLIAMAMIIVTSISGGYWYSTLSDGTECNFVSLASTFSPSAISLDGGMSVLNVEITPQQDFTNQIIIDIIPQNTNVLKIEREGIEKLGDRYQYKVPQQKRYKGDKFVTTFNVTATCNCIRGTWDVDVRVIVVDNCAVTRAVQFIVEPPEEKKS